MFLIERARLAQLLPQVTDVDIDGPVDDRLLLAPEEVEDLVTGEDASWPRGQELEDPELGRRQLQFGAVGE